MWTSLFWKDAVERAIRTFAQTLLALIGTGAATSIVALNWPELLGVAGLASLLSVLMSVIAGGVSKTVSPASLAKDERGI